MKVLYSLIVSSKFGLIAMYGSIVIRKTRSHNRFLYIWTAWKTDVFWIFFLWLCSILVKGQSHGMSRQNLIFVKGYLRKTAILVNPLLAGLEKLNRRKERGALFWVLKVRTKKIFKYTAKILKKSSSKRSTCKYSKFPCANDSFGNRPNLTDHLFGILKQLFSFSS